VGLAFFGHYWLSHGNETAARSFAFGSFAINSMIYIFAYRSLRRSIFRVGSLRQNKPLAWAVAAGLITALAAILLPQLRALLGVVPLDPSQWALIAAVALGLLAVVEAGKYWANHGYRQAGKPAVE